jgi:hypothetical protein
MKNDYFCGQASIYDYLSVIEDCRTEKKCLHRLSDILFIVLATYLSNGEDNEDKVLFSHTHKSFLQEYIELATTFLPMTPSIVYFRCWSRIFCVNA